MERIILTIFYFIFITGCASHFQESETIEPPPKVVKSEEKDPTLILINGVENGDVALVRKILTKGANVETKNNEGLTLLMMAVRSQQFAVTELLMEFGANPEAETTIKETKETSVDVIFDDKDESSFFAEEEESNVVTAFTFAKGDSGTMEILRSLLLKEPIDGDNANLPLFDVIQEKNGDNLQWLLGKGADPNFIKDKKTTPLIFLFSLRGVKGEELQKLTLIFDILVTHEDIDVGLKVGRRKNTALKKAKRRLKKNPEYQPMVDRLIEMGA